MLQLLSSLFFDGVNIFDLRLFFLELVGVMFGVGPSLSSLLTDAVLTAIVLSSQEGTINFTSELDPNETVDLSGIEMVKQ